MTAASEVRGKISAADAVTEEQLDRFLARGEYAIA